MSPEYTKRHLTAQHNICQLSRMQCKFLLKGKTFPSRDYEDPTGVRNCSTIIGIVNFGLR